MNYYIDIVKWIETKRIQSNKPTKWQKLLAWMKLKPLAIPKYWYQADITITVPHSLRTGDIILTYSLAKYCVMQRLHQNNLGLLETFTITSIEPLETGIPELGETVIISHACMNEMDPNTQPYGGQII